MNPIVSRVSLGVGKSYIILSGDDDFDTNSPEFREYASQLEYVLAEHGYTRLQEDALNEAAVAIYLSADISEPSKRYHTVQTPLYETDYNQTAPGETRSAPGSRPGQGGGGTTSSSGPPIRIDRNPAERISGYEKAKFATTVYKKYLSIIAVDLQQYLEDVAASGKAKAVPREIWSVDVETTGTPSDLDEVMPVMIAAAKPYVGRSTADTVRVSLDENSAKVDEIRAAVSD